MLVLRFQDQEYDCIQAETATASGSANYPSGLDDEILAKEFLLHRIDLAISKKVYVLLPKSPNG